MQEPTPRYSYIYNNLVSGPEDFIGLVAYSIYKREKIAYIRDFEKNHDGKSPNTEELLEFHKMAHCLLENYKELATIYVSRFCNDICMEYTSKLKEEYKGKLRWAKCSGWAAAITQSVIGSIIGAILVGVLVILLLYSRYGLEWVIKDAVNTYMITNPPIEEPRKTK